VKEPEGLVIVLSSAVGQVRNREKELLVEVLALVRSIVELVWRQGGKRMIESVFPNTFSTLFNLVLNQYK
jgi:hypothetical protein